MVTPDLTLAVEASLSGVPGSSPTEALESALSGRATYFNL
jgi:hypothetical protein